MARKTKMIKIDDQEITVKELRIEDILSLLDAADEQNKTAGQQKDSKDPQETMGWMGTVREHLPKFMDLNPDKVPGMAPSELKEVFDAAKEVNAVFFEAARALGAEKILAELKASLERDFSAIVADSLKKVTPA